MTNICLLVLIGIPGVGKTQLSKFIINKLNSSNITFHFISFDEYEQNLNSDVYKLFRNNIYEMAENLIKSLKDLSKNDKNLIIIDDNMYYRSMRRIYYTLAKRFQTSYCQIFVTCPIELAIQRNKDRGNTLSNHIIHNMAKKIEPPLEKNQWEKYTITIDSTNPYNLDHLNCILQIVENSLQNPVIIMENTIEYNHVSFVHNVDLILRKIVGTLLKESRKQDKSMIQILSKELCRRKKIILNNLKSNNLFLPEFENDTQLFGILLDLFKNDKCVQ